MDTAIFDTLSDARASETLKRLHRQAGKLDAGLIVRFARLAPRILTKRSVPWNQLERDFDTDFLAVEPDYGVFCYQMARALRARRIVEFGTSFGLSTIYLALAVRDNGGGEVIGTELVPAKAEKARDHLREAGVEQYVDIRVGDVRETLSTLDGEVDIHLNDGFPHRALTAIALVGLQIAPAWALLWVPCLGFGTGAGMLLGLIFVGLRTNNGKTVCPLSD